MKTLICACGILLIATVFAHGMDMEVGTIALSGSTGLNYRDTTTEPEMGDDIDAKTLSAELDVEYYVIRNVGVGIVGFYTKDEYGDMESDEILIGPSVTVNFSLSDPLSAVVFAAGGYASADDGFDEYTGWGWTAGAGLRWFFNSRVAVLARANYMMLTLEDGMEFDQKGIDAAVGFTVLLNE